MGLSLDPSFFGDAYEGDTCITSDMLRAAMGDDVVDHYLRATEVEIEGFDRVVTDYKMVRGECT